MVIGIDIGYGYTKIYTHNQEETEQKILFPTLVSRYIQNESATFGEKVHPINVNGNSYIVGEDVRRASVGDFSVTTDFVGKEEYFAIIGYALKTIKGDLNYMVLGLPPGIYTKNKVNNLIDTFYSTVMTNSFSAPLQYPKTVKYIPQGVGIYFAYLKEEDPDAKDANVAVIDIGHKTLDIILMARGNYIEGAARSYPIGVKLLYDQIKTAFSQSTGRFISNEMVDKLIQKHKIEHFGEIITFDPTPIIDTFYKEQVTKALKNFSEFVAEQKFDIEKVLIGGGGVVYASNIKFATIVKDPQFANARGYYYYGKAFEEKEK